MSRHILVVLLAALLALGLALAVIPNLTAASLPASNVDAGAKPLAEKLLKTGAELFTAKDAPGIAATYLDDAVLTVVGQDSQSHVFRTQVNNGRSAIESYYQSLFKPDSVFHARNEVEYARFIGPELLLITGHFVLDTTQPNPLSLPFVQVRQKQGDAWRIMNLQVFVVAEKS